MKINATSILETAGDYLANQVFYMSEICAPSRAASSEQCALALVELVESFVPDKELGPDRRLWKRWLWLCVKYKVPKKRRWNTAIAFFEKF